jgi:hypothetical protein
MVGPLRAVVPFAKGARGIASGLEGVGDGFFREIQPLLAGRDAAHAAARMITAGEKFRASRRTDGLHVEAIERGSAGRDAVDVGRGNLRVPREAVVAPAGVVGEEDHDIGAGGRRGGGKRRGGSKQQAGESEDGSEVHGERGEVAGLFFLLRLLGVGLG